MSRSYPNPIDARAVPVLGLRPPCVGGRYVVTRFLGRGAQARVYLAWDLRLRQWRAVKILAEELAEDAEHVARFEREAEAMAELCHPNLVKVVDVDADGQLPYLVMELGRGGTVHEWLRRNGPMPPRLAVDVAVQCAEGLRHAHERGVVHRDVKPQNLLLHEDGRVVVIDFGVARREGSPESLGRSVGTYTYMAPEQRAEPSTVDGRADVYGLGVTLRTLLRGRSASARATDPDELVPEPLKPVVFAACQDDRERRYRTMGALLEDLRRTARQLGEVPEGRVLVDRLVPLPESTPPTRLETTEDLDRLHGATAGSEEDEPTQVSIPVPPPVHTPTPPPPPIRVQSPSAAGDPPALKLGESALTADGWDGDPRDPPRPRVPEEAVTTAAGVALLLLWAAFVLIARHVA